MKKLVIADYGMGNLHSVLKGIQKTKVPVVLSSKPGELKKAAGIIIPGVGAFKDAMRELRKRGLYKAVKNEVRKGKPVMGICLGMQLLFSDSSEFGKHKGFGFIKGKVVKFRTGLKVPHMGWNTCKKAKKDPALAGIRDMRHYYFVHSYYCVPSDKKVILTKTQYGSTVFTSGAALNNVYGFQFHPEKSGEKALRIYKNFFEICKNIK